MASATKTLQYRLETNHLDWFQATKELYSEVTGFYLCLLLEKPELLNLSQKDVLTELERLTVVSKNRLTVEYLLPWDLPMVLRRACINQAIGAAKSFKTNLRKWEARKAKKLEKGKPFTERPPVPPRRFNWNPTFYSGLQKQFTGTSILLKLWTGKSWVWVKFRLCGQTIPDGWEMQCPKTVIKGNLIFLHLPIQKLFKSPQKVENQVKGSHFRLCSVDLNIGENLAVCTILDGDGNQLDSKFIKGGANLQSRRKCRLGRVARNRRRTGIIVKGEQDNKQLWVDIQNINEYEAHRISRRIVDYALANNATVIVFEHLGNFKPQKGKYSKRGNEKRSYWLRGKIFKFTKYKAWSEALITCRVNPKNTSRDCACCGAKVARYGENEPPIDYHPGAPLFTCPQCGRRGNADLNAARNIGLRLLKRYTEKPLKIQERLTGDKLDNSRTEGCLDSPCSLLGDKADNIAEVARESEQASGAALSFPESHDTELRDYFQVELWGNPVVESKTQMQRTRRTPGRAKKRFPPEGTVQLELPLWE
jgi:IS605 OrfB family transposase